MLNLPEFRPQAKAQRELFGAAPPKTRSILVSSSMGVDSTVRLVMLQQADIRPSHITFAIRGFKQAYVGLVTIEARAEGTLTDLTRYKSVKGERGATPKPGKMTDFIRSEGLLTSEMIDHIIETILKGRVTPEMGAQGAGHVRIYRLSFLEQYLDEDEQMDLYFIPEAQEVEELVDYVYNGRYANYFCGGGGNT